MPGFTIVKVESEKNDFCCCVCGFSAKTRNHKKLETGAAQPEAIVLYTKQGYEPIERFGEYEHDENSLCYGKKLHLSL